MAGSGREGLTEGRCMCGGLITNSGELYYVFFLLGRWGSKRDRELWLGAEGRQGGNMPVGLPERSGDAGGEQ